MSRLREVIWLAQELRLVEPNAREAFLRERRSYLSNKGLGVNEVSELFADARALLLFVDEKLT